MNYEESAILLNERSGINPWPLSFGGQPASESTCKDMADRITKDLGDDARQYFHDLKEGADRTLRQLKEDAAEVYRQFGGGDPPSWMQ